MSKAEHDIPPPLDPGHELPPESELEAVEDAGNEKLAQLQAEYDRLNDRLLRTLADADNARKRAFRENQEARQQAVIEAVRPFLAVLDNFERALAHGGAAVADLRQGLELLHRQMQDAVRKAGLTPVPALHQPFDPHLHEAVEMVESEEHASGSVVEELQRGYKLNDKLVRPAMVRVAQGRS